MGANSISAPFAWYIHTHTLSSNLNKFRLVNANAVFVVHSRVWKDGTVRFDAVRAGRLGTDRLSFLARCILTTFLRPSPAARIVFEYVCFFQIWRLFFFYVMFVFLWSIAVQSMQWIGRSAGPPLPVLFAVQP